MRAGLSGLESGLWWVKVVCEAVAALASTRELSMGHEGAEKKDERDSDRGRDADLAFLLRRPLGLDGRGDGGEGEESSAAESVGDLSQESERGRVKTKVRSPISLSVGGQFFFSSSSPFSSSPPLPLAFPSSDRPSPWRGA